MRLVLDTNVLISGLVSRGKPRQLLELSFSGVFIGYTSEYLLDELRKVLKKKFGFEEQQLAEIEKILRSHFIVTTPLHTPTAITRDPSDNQVLAISHAEKVDVIVSGDRDLLTLEQYKGVPIMTVAEVLQKLLIK